LFRIAAIAIILILIYLILRNRANNIRENERKKLEHEIKEKIEDNDSIIIFSNLIQKFFIYKYGKEKGYNDNFI
jgi:CRISPR/Cas system-associated endoribonuclease Cas2